MVKGLATRWGGWDNINYWAEPHARSYPTPRLTNTPAGRWWINPSRSCPIFTREGGRWNFPCPPWWIYNLRRRMEWGGVIRTVHIWLWLSIETRNFGLAGRYGYCKNISVNLGCSHVVLKVNNSIFKINCIVELQLWYLIWNQRFSFFY